MLTRTSAATWNGDLKSGKGTIALGSGAYQGAYSFASRFEQAPGTNPEELIAAAHAGCYSMALSHALAEAGHVAQRVHTVAKVHLDKVSDGFRIAKIELETDAAEPGLDEAAFQKQAADAKKNCPVSKLLTGAEITLKARLVTA